MSNSQPDPAVTETPPPDPPAGSPATVETPEPPAAPGAAEAEETFPRDYVEKLREENASWRTKLRTYEDAFEGYADPERERYLELARKIADPDQQLTAAEEFEAIAHRIKEARSDSTAPPTRPSGEEDPDQKPLTVAQWKKMQAEQDEQTQLQAAVTSIEREATELGVPPTVEVNGEVKDNPRYVLLLHAAQAPEVAGDLTKAAEALKFFEQDVINRHTSEVQGMSEKYPTPPGQAPGGAPADQQGGPPKTYKEARKGAMAFLAAKAGQ